MKKKLVSLVVGVAMLVTLPVVSAFAADDVINLTVQSHDPQTSATGAFLDAWAAKVKKASNGKLNVKVFHGGALGGPRDTVDMVLNGTADIGWGLPSFFPGRFPMTEVMSLPMMGIKSSTQGSAAMWELYSTTDYLKKEYENFKVILVHTNCDSPVSTKKVEIKTVDQFKGMKIRGNAGPATEFIKQLGASPIAIVIGELYSSMEKGVLDAVITDWHAIKAFKLAEQINFYLDEHMGVSPYFLLMNKAKYAALPADLQKVIDSVSGEGALDVAGPSWDKVQNEIIAKVKADKKKKIYTLSAAEHNKLQAVADATKAAWVKGKTEAGFPAQAVADKAAELVAKYAK